MLTLEVKSIECWDEDNRRFVYTPSGILQLEHSLYSLSKWEQKWHKAFLKDDPKTAEESIDYIKQMTLNEVDPDIYNGLTSEHYKRINEYLRDPMTATTFGKEKKKPERNTKFVTNEIIYYWMVELQIPFDPCQYWHLNRLMTLIKVINIKRTTPTKKTPTKDLMNKYRALNNARKGSGMGN